VSGTDTIDPATAAAEDKNKLSSLDLDAALKNALRGETTKINTHLVELQKDIIVGATKTRLHCYFLPLDANGRVRVKPLAEFLRDQVIDYAIPRKTIQEAQEQASRSGSMAPISKLHERAKGLFTHLAKSGEGGELLLFAMAEAIFGLTQIICKMTLKTSTAVHYHGSDGVYAQARTDGGLDLYWGESKVHGDVKQAIRECLTSLAPYLIDPDAADSARHQDILLINEFANFGDERIVDGLKRYLDLDDPASLKTRHCGVALIGFDCDAYPKDDPKNTAEQIAQAIKSQLASWTETVGTRVAHEKLEQIDIHFICVPLRSASEFRKYFLGLMGVTDEA